jgi:hypothetical protein
MSAYELQKPGNYPKESIRHSERGESLKSRTVEVLAALCSLWHYRKDFNSVSVNSSIYVKLMVTFSIKSTQISLPTYLLHGVS